MTDAPFVPAGYMSHLGALRSAYLFKFGPMDPDKILSDRQKTDPVTYLFQESRSPIREQRLRATRNALLQKLSAGEIKGYSPVVLSTNAMWRHKTAKLPLPGPVDPIFQLGIWSTDAGATGLLNGKVGWAFSHYDKVTERPLFFSVTEIDTAFPDEVDATIAMLSPKVREGVPIYERRWPKGHKAAGIPTDIRAIDILLKEDGYKIGADKFRELKAACKIRGRSDCRK